MKDSITSAIPTAEQLTKYKLAIAKLLPERIEYSEKYGFIWKHRSQHGLGDMVHDTEWLQIVQWVEEGLTDEQMELYDSELYRVVAQDYNQRNPSRAFRILSHWQKRVVMNKATFSQRLAALEAAGIINTNNL